MSLLVDKIAGSDSVSDPPMPFSAHLNELRRRLINVVLILAAGAVLVFYFSNRILDYLARPVGHLVFISPLEAFHARLEVALAGGLVLTMPLLLRQAWLFLAPALSVEWRKTVLRMLPLSYFLFAAGASLGFFVVIPATLRFLMAFGTPSVKPMMTLGAYLGFIVKMTLAFGAVFQMPLVFYALNRAGVIERESFASYRKGVYFLCFVAGAFLSPDVFAQFCIAIPSILLFEITLLAMRR
ncbi:MAG: twin-arginine translocase subunit TatC [Elusimicrobia bacterium]|nr:twin-arginine translocase subunit TatC [Elusimicrobiota bacterium]